MNPKVRWFPSVSPLEHGTHGLIKDLIGICDSTVT
jgi:hypothetical protein